MLQCDGHLAAVAFERSFRLFSPALFNFIIFTLFRSAHQIFFGMMRSTHPDNVNNYGAPRRPRNESGRTTTGPLPVVAAENTGVGCRLGRRQHLRLPRLRGLWGVRRQRLGPRSLILPLAKCISRRIRRATAACRPSYEVLSSPKHQQSQLAFTDTSNPRTLPGWAPPIGGHGASARSRPSRRVLPTPSSLTRLFPLFLTSLVEVFGERG